MRQYLCPQIWKSGGDIGSSVRSKHLKACILKSSSKKADPYFWWFEWSPFCEVMYAPFKHQSASLLVNIYLEKCWSLQLQSRSANSRWWVYFLVKIKKKSWHILTCFLKHNSKYFDDLLTLRWTIVALWAICFWIYCLRENYHDLEIVF